MFVERFSGYYIDSCLRTIQKVTTRGKYKNINFQIENYNYKGTTIEKRMIAFGDTWQKIVSKSRNKDGKFERLA